MMVPERLFVLWKMEKGLSPFTGEPRIKQNTPTFKSTGKSHDAILVYSSIEKMILTMRELQADPSWRSFLMGYDPLDYIRSFEAHTVADYWDAHNLLLDLSAVEVQLLLRYNDEDRISWIQELPDVRMKGVTIIGGFQWQ